MSKDPREFIDIFKCPDCESDLIVDGENLQCSKCERVIPIVNGVAIFLSQKDWKDFFGKSYNFENYILDEEKDFIKELLSQESYLESIKIINKHTDSVENKEMFIEMIKSTGVMDDAQEAVLKANDKTIEKGNISNAKMILDWPTGPGSCIRRMVDKINQDTVIVSSEINLIAIFRLKKFLESKGLDKNILFVNNDVTKMPFKNDIFDLVTVFGLTVEIPDPGHALKETYRVMKNSGILVGNGEMYKDGSESMKLADEMNLGQLCTRERFAKKINEIGFKNIDIESAYEGYDEGGSSDEERCPLPARGDWFSYVIVKAEK